MDGINSLISMPGLSGAGGLGARMSAADAAALRNETKGEDAVRLANQQDFSAILGKAVEGPAKEGPLTEAERKEQAKQAAQDFVAVAFVVPILKQFRESSHAAPPFAPSSGEKQFRSLSDGQMARQIVRSANFPIVDRIAKDLANAKNRRAEGGK